MMSRPHRWRIGLTVALFLTWALALVPTARAATFTVTSLNDSGPGSLREAIILANARAGTDTITFSIGGTITLGSSLPSITDAAGLTINGGSVVTISGNNAVQVLQVNSGAALTVQNLVIAHGNTNLLAGGLSNSGTVTISNSTFS